MTPQTTRTATRRGRAKAMAPDERRAAIVDAVVPLLMEHGADVSTRRIAQAAGIAEGTIFRVFPDKASLLLAAAGEVMNPASGRADLEAALAPLDSLRAKLLVTTEQLYARSERVMVVMMALRTIWITQAQAGEDHDHGSSDPQRFFAEMNAALHELLTDVFAPHADELRVDAGTAAVLLRTLVLGSRHPGSDPAHRLGPEQIVDALLLGVTSRAADEGR